MFAQQASTIEKEKGKETIEVENFNNDLEIPEILKSMKMKRWK